jgi:alkylhydroperoxidase/carboxymuconolactone decarboxylase family protein YurZ
VSVPGPDPNEIRQDRETLSPAMDEAFRRSPEMMAHFYQVMKHARLEGNGPHIERALLGPKWRELITVALLAGIRSADGLRLHIGKAMDLGATPDEVAESLEPCLVTMGAPSYLAGMAALREVMLRREGVKPSIRQVMSVEGKSEDSQG